MINVEFINAGAGSGKTHKLVTLLAGYLGGKLGNYQPGEVILTTFTELAAAEFRERARAVLLQNEMYEKASQLDNASIGTVHAVAYSFVRKYWYLLGRGASENVMSENDKQFYINQSLANIATENDILFFEDLLREFGFSKFEGNKSIENSDYWNDHLRSIIVKMEQYEIEDLAQSREKSIQLIDRIFTTDEDFDGDAAIESLKRYIEICNNNAKVTLAKKIINAGKVRYSSILELAGLEPIQRERNLLPQIDNIIAAAATAVRSKQYGEKLKSYLDRIFNLAQEWKHEYNGYKAKNRLIDYNDMERLFLELLNKDEIKGEIREKCKLVFVDEFQDSSPIQIKIFSRLSELAEQSIWVGDPKQAIYGFRGSDAFLIKAITDIFNTGDEANHLRNGDPLNISYRSRPGLVHLANDIFIRAFDDMNPDQIRLRTYRNDSEEFGKDAGDELEHWHFNLGNQSANKTDHFQNLAQQIVRLLNEGTQVFDKSLKNLRKAAPEDIVVLCRTNREANDISGILQQYGVKTAGQNTDSSYLETAEVKLFIAILNYILNRNNDLAKAEILHLVDMENYPIANIIRSRLDYLPSRRAALDERKNNEEAVIPRWENENPFIQRIDSLSPRIKALPVPDLVEALIILLDLKTVVSKWGNTERRIKNLEAIVKHASDYDQHALQLGLGASLNNFVVFLTGLANQEEKAEKVKGSVNILTYHKAKGLEWNIVILESLDFDELSTDEMIRKSFFGINDIITGDAEEGELFPERYIQLLPWFLGSKKTVQEDIKALITESEEFAYLNDKIRAEIKRLMYVGVTRARDYLITTSYHKDQLCWLANIGCAMIAPGESSGNSLNIWDTAHHSIFTRCEKDPDYAGQDVEWDLQSLIKPGIMTEFEPRHISPSKLQQELDPVVTVNHVFNHRIAVAVHANGDGESPTDAQIGTCLHDIFCIYRQGSEKNMEKARLVLLNRNMQSVFPEPERIIASMDNLYGYLNRKYPNPIKVFKELPLQKSTKEGQIIRGSCDLLWETPEGSVLVDYKSFPGRIDQITSAVDEHFAGIYAPQLETYRNILEASGKNVVATYIYYAVMGVIAEIRVH